MHVKRMIAVLLLSVCIFLCGCSGEKDALDRPMALRTKLLQGGCSFTVDITADYGDELYSFSMACTADAEGDCTFTVIEPQSIAGITGRIAGERGTLTFGDVSLGFSMLADGQVTPVSAPWIIVKTLRGGFLRAAGEDSDGLRVTINDSYAADALTLDIWLDETDAPISAQIYYDGRSILSVQVKDFTLL